MTTNLTAEQARDLWARLIEYGIPPRTIAEARQQLPTYTVQIDPWIERLRDTYLRDLACRSPYFKLVVGPYGSGKTHFLLDLGIHALDEGFAVAYVSCRDNVIFDNFQQVYEQVVNDLWLPNSDAHGMKEFVDRLLTAKKEVTASLSQPQQALDGWIDSLQDKDYDEPTFGRMLAFVLGELVRNEGRLTDTGRVAMEWLRGKFDSANKADREALRIKPPTKAGVSELGLRMFTSFVGELVESGLAKGLVVLVDETDTMHHQARKTTLKLLGAMRVLIDLDRQSRQSLPVLTVFAGVPDIRDLIKQQRAVETRLNVSGYPFHDGNDRAAILDLEKTGDRKEFLSAVGHKLLDLAQMALGHPFDHTIQEKNLTTLIDKATERNLDIDVRRLFIKTWTNLLEMQAKQGETEFPADELSLRYQGQFDDLEQKADDDGGTT